MTPGWSALEVALNLLERYAREGKHSERLEIATKMLELHPDTAALHAHRALALLGLEREEAARAALCDAARRCFVRGEPLPQALLEVSHALMVRRIVRDAPPRPVH